MRFRSKPEGNFFRLAYVRRAQIFAKTVYLFAGIPLPDLGNDPGQHGTREPLVHRRKPVITHRNQPHFCNSRTHRERTLYVQNPTAGGVTKWVSPPERRHIRIQSLYLVSSRRNRDCSVARVPPTNAKSISRLM